MALTSSLFSLTAVFLREQENIAIEIDRVKNNNSEAEKAIRELENELLLKYPCGGIVTTPTVTVETAQLNARIQEESC